MATKTLPDGRTVMDPSDATREWDIRNKLDAIVDVFESNYANWDTMTASQRNQASKDAQRFCANVARFLSARFDTSGD